VLLCHAAFWLHATELPEDSYLHNDRRENLKSHTADYILTKILFEIKK
jgi:hypothetical protein